ncbi:MULTISPECIES: GNAT family N-acetyltransferase [Haloferax]|uniref:GNAT family N-acetyltransferase n=1 Tax=Haloferax marinum TaxID=2666143 RepID=A0A6A8G2B3_9EURY|nr:MULTISPECIES: GNAT family protein [Haloferax]KAB1196203.1 GNAT family N-acetyltransferase [Haloferax sp. CBA1150]MRW95191.1 GNAT family N-acetyltransferase [Haloferax marinum]
MKDTTVVEGERVSLRPVERDDTDLLQRSMTDPAIRIPLGSEPRNEHETTEFIEEYVEGSDNLSFVVEAEGERIGIVAVKSLKPARPELVYWFLPAYHGQGYGTEAVGSLVEYVFNAVDCHGLTAIVFEFNEGSRRLLERLGFEEEGRLREHRFVDGAYVDVLRFGLLRREWEQARSD